MEPSKEPRWFDEHERQAWLAILSVLARLPGALDSQLQRDADISHFEYQVISGLSIAPDRRLRISELAVFTGGSLARLSQAVTRLDKRGWVRRSTDPADGRYTLATLTDEGWAKVVETAPGHVDALRRYVFDPLSKSQIEQLAKMSQRITRAIDSDTSEP